MRRRRAPRRGCEPAGMLRHRRWPAALVAGAAASALIWAQPDIADASYPHTVLEGETLSGIAAANGISTESLASFNGISSETYVVIGETVNIPSSTELGTTTTTSTTTSTTSTAAGPPASAPTYWTAEIYSPLGTAYLASSAAANWEAMRQSGLRHIRHRYLPGRLALRLPHLRAAELPRTTSTCRGSARRRTRPAPHRTSTGPPSTSPAPRRGPWSTTSAPPTAGARSTGPTSGGTSTTTGAEEGLARSGDAALEHVEIRIEPT